MVVVEEDVAPLTLVAAEEHLARRHQRALAAVFSRRDLGQQLEKKCEVSSRLSKVPQDRACAISCQHHLLNTMAPMQTAMTTDQEVICSQSRATFNKLGYHTYEFIYICFLSNSVQVASRYQTDKFLT